MATQDKDFHNIDDLSRKVNSEYEAFIDDMKTQPPEKIIEAAYEITWKDSINQFIANEDVLLSYNQLNALLSSKNTLDEIYEQWCQNGELHSYDDIQTALDDTANNIALSLERSNNAELTAKPQEKPTVLVDGDLKEIPAIFDNQGNAITGDFLKKTIDRVSQFNEQREQESKDYGLWWLEYEDLPSTSMIADLPPAEVENEIKFNAQTNVFEMSQAAFEWFEQYAPKHNEVSELEAKINPYISDYPNEKYYGSDEYYYSHCTDYRSSNTINLNEAVNVKSEWLRDYAAKKGIDIDGIEKIPDLPQRLQLQANPAQKTELIPIESVTPEFLEQFAQKTNSFYPSGLEDVPECRIRYGLDIDENAVRFETLNFDSDDEFIPGEIRVLAGGDLGNALWENFKDEMETGFNINLEDLVPKYEASRTSTKSLETEKPLKPSLSERIDKARAENPRVNALKQEQQRTNSSQEL